MECETYKGSSRSSSLSVDDKVAFDLNPDTNYCGECLNGSSQEANSKRLMELLFIENKRK